MGRIDKLLLIILVLVAGFTRLWRISEYMTFLGDEGRDATVVRDIIKGGKYTLIGPGTSVGNMYLGPWYYYLMIPSLALANFSPVGPAIMIALFSVLTVLLLWWLAKVWFGKFPAWLSAFIYALSPTVITYSHSSWNPNIMPFFSLLSIYSVWAICHYRKFAFYPVLGFCLAMILNSHYLGILLFPALFIFLIKGKHPSSILPPLSSLLIFVFMMSPLVIFDARHGWQNFQSFKKFITVRQETVNLKPYKAIPNLWPIYTQINSSLLLAKYDKYSPLLSSIVLISLIYALKFNRLKIKVYLIAGILGFGILGLGLYKQHIYDHYFGFLFPVVFLSLAAVFKTLDQKLSFVVFLLLLILNISKNPFWSEPNRQLWRTQQIANLINSLNPNQTYNLALISNHNYDASYRYFLNSNYRTLHQQNTGQLYVVCENPDCNPINHPLWEIAGFGWAKIDQTWDFTWGVKLFRLISNPSGQS